MTRSIYLGPKKNPRLMPWVFVTKRDASVYC